MIKENLYLWLDLFTLSFPLIRSFEPRLQYAKKWYALFPAILAVDIVYIIWDILFTKAGIWGFNHQYLVDINIVNLPLEEWLFFLVVPFACVFIYEATNYFINPIRIEKYAKPVALFLGTLLLVAGFWNYDKTYTVLTFTLAGAFLWFHVLFIRRNYLSRFWIGYLFSLLPFLLVNGILTGSFLEEPIVWYNNDENLGIRIFTIPIEDSMYLLLYLLGITTIYEAILKRF